MTIGAIVLIIMKIINCRNKFFVFDSIQIEIFMMVFASYQNTDRRSSVIMEVTSMTDLFSFF